VLAICLLLAEPFGNIVGISENCGHALTWKILTCDTQHIIYRSLARPALPEDAKLRVGMFDGEEDDHTVSNSKLVIKSHHNLKHARKNDGENNNHIDGEINPNPTPVFNPEVLIGKKILMDKKEDGCQTRATIVKLIEDHESSIHDNLVRIEFSPITQ
jgi:hypothetical protein